jgi:hypothetical protein
MWSVEEWSSWLDGHPVKFPQMDPGKMLLLSGVLRLAVYRTAEEVKGNR